VSKLHIFADTQAIVEECNPAPDRIVTGSPVGETVNVFESRDGKLFSGIWRSTKGAWRVVYDETEYCHITKGRARLSSDDGTIKHVGVGDSFVIEGGFRGIWDVLEDMEKHYMIIVP
jgi:uncharacterized protein